jgi:spore coat protein U-like protein
MSKVTVIHICLFGILFIPTTAFAETDSKTMTVSASISSICSISTTPLNFGEVELTGATNATATLSVQCTNGGAWTIGMDEGLNFVAAARFLKSGTQKLAYDLFTDPARGARWTGAGAGLKSGTGTGAQQIVTVYGQVTTGQILIATGGVPYTDTITVTMNF